MRLKIENNELQIVLLVTPKPYESVIDNSMLVEIWRPKIGISRVFARDLRQNNGEEIDWTNSDHWG